MATARGNPVEWDHFYKTARWQRLLRLRLRQHPLVRVLPGARHRHGGDRGWNHVTPHKGDWNAFVTGELQSLCEPCHKSAKRQIELRGYTVTSGSTATRPIRIIRSIGQDSSAD